MDRPGGAGYGAVLGSRDLNASSTAPFKTSEKRPRGDAEPAAWGVEEVCEFFLEVLGPACQEALQRVRENGVDGEVGLLYTLAHYPLGAGPWRHRRDILDAPRGGSLLFKKFGCRRQTPGTSRQRFSP